jgi:hypothetical protein
MNPYSATIDLSVFVANLEPYLISLIKRHTKQDDEDIIPERAMVAAVEKFLQSSDFNYLVEDAVNSQVEELVSSCIHNTSLRIEIE